MARLFLILLAALALTGAMFVGLVYALDHFGWYPIFDSHHALIRRTLLQLGGFLPGLLAFAASLVAAFVSFRLVTLQEASRRDLESFKADLSDKLETVRMQAALSAHDAEQVSLHLSYALRAAASYLTLLEQLGEGRFDAEAVHAAEQEAKQTAAVLGGSSAARAAYDQFLQAGTSIAASGAEVITWWRRKQIWTDRGRQFSDLFVELQTRIEEARAAARNQAARMDAVRDDALRYDARQNDMVRDSAERDAATEAAGESANPPHVLPA